MAQITLNSSGVASNGTLKLQSNGTTDAVTIDTSQNMGLGVTPSATTGSGVKGFEIGGVGNGLLGNSANVWATQNVYFGAGFKKAGAGYATMYNQSGGTHNWNVSTTSGGAAGDAITFTQAMTLDASGNLGVGTTSPNKTAIGRALTVNGSANAGLELAASDVCYGLIFANSARFSLDTNNSGANIINFYTSGAERARIDSSGNLLVGTTTGTGDGITLRPRVSAGSTSQINFNRASTTTVGYPINFQNGGSDVGYISMSNSAVAYVTSSDYRLKNTVAPMTGALAKVAALKPCTYKWNADGSDGEGFIAHELAEVCPDAVVGEKDAVDADGNPKYQGIDTSFLVATLTAALQEMKAIVDAQAARITALEQA